MNLEKAYEDRFGDFPFRNIVYYLIGGQVLAYIITFAYPGLMDALILRGNLVIGGQWWRVFSFLFLPVSTQPVWVVLEWYFMYIIGSALEAVWGSFRLSTYLTVAYVATIVAAFLFPSDAFSNGYLFGSMFLAFAYLNPDFLLYLFFIIPVKIKWFALLAWIGFVWTMLTGGIADKIQSALAVVNFFLFFGQELWLRFGGMVRHGKHIGRVVRTATKTYLRCVSCGATERDGKIFYACHECMPQAQFCEEHIDAHPHRVVH